VLIVGLLVAKINLKTFELLSISLWLVMILSSCSLPGLSASPTQTVDQNLVGNAAATSLQDHSTQTQTVIITTNIAAPATATQIPPNTPVWSAYKYTIPHLMLILPLLPQERH
jgi:hypothetical protein